MGRPQKIPISTIETRHECHRKSRPILATQHTSAYRDLQTVHTLGYASAQLQDRMGVCTAHRRERIDTVVRLFVYNLYSIYIERSSYCVSFLFFLFFLILSVVSSDFFFFFF